MSSTQLINQVVAEQRHASEHQQQISANSAAPPKPNVGLTERQISVAAGAVLAALGLTRGGLSGLTLLGIGGSLVYRGATGSCSIYRALGVDTAETTA